MEAASKSKRMIRFSSVSSGDEETDDNTQFGMLLDIDLLSCPICVEGFTGPIFQCDNGHLACSSCCSKLRNKCSSCGLPIGIIRCRGVEKMIESIVFRCPNFKHGCQDNLFSKDDKTHKEKCLFLQCSCPLQSCNYKGTYKNLYRHFYLTHNSVDYPRNLCENRITWGQYFNVVMDITDKMCFLMGTDNTLLFVIQCFNEPYGACVTIKCIAPGSREVGEFSYSVSMNYYGYVVKSEFPNMRKVQEVSFEDPREDFMLFPSYFLRRNGNTLKLNVCINKKSF